MGSRRGRVDVSAVQRECDDVSERLRVKLVASKSGPQIGTVYAWFPAAAVVAWDSGAISRQPLKSIVTLTGRAK